MSNRYLYKMAASCCAVMVLAGVASCGSKETVPKIQEDIEIPRMTIGETITGEPESPAGDTMTQTTPPPSPETPIGGTPPAATPPPEFGHPH